MLETVMSINQSVRRIDAEKKVRGLPIFTSDIHLPNLAYMKILFARYPHAKIHNIDTRQAEKLPGVLGVLTAMDVPVNEFGFVTNDQPVLCGPASQKPDTDRVRFLGDKVALVIADTEETATQALALINVDYEVLPVLDDPIKAMEPDAAVIHDYLGHNIFTHRKIRTGDVNKGFEEADVIVESDYLTPTQEHMFFEPEGGVGYVDQNGVVTCHVTGQWPHHDKKQICHALALPEEKVRVIYPVIGGAFGGREDVSIQIVLALAAWRLHQRGMTRPIKITLTREESSLVHCKRHPYLIHAKWGATKDGKLTAAEVDMVADGGAYIYTSHLVAGNIILNCTGPYVIPNVKVDVRNVYTNNIPKGAFRGFGGPQGAFVSESQMEKLAEKLGMDSVEFRLRNLAREGDLQSTQAPYPPGCSIAKVVETCALAGGWKNNHEHWSRPEKKDIAVSDKPYLKRGLGLACAHKNVGFSYGFREFCGVSIELHGDAEIEKAVVYHGAAEVGQGIYTVISQMASEALRLPLEKVQLRASDTQTSLNSGSVSASRMTFVAGNAIREAAEMVLEKWNNEDRPAIVHHTYQADPTTAPDTETGHCDPNVTYAYVAEIAEVEVDIQTGKCRVVRIICAEDVGKAINPLIVEGQIEGGLLQGVGYTVMESFIEKNGHTLTPNFSTYLIPTILDIPERMDTLILEYPDPRGPWGARGVGEVAIMATAPAIISAVHDAIGVRFDQFTLTPDLIMKGLGKLP
jgi:CO/xanthine dehydrogenase Mo-binding subunit